MKPLHFNGEMSATKIWVTRSMPVLPIVYSSSPVVGFSARSIQFPHVVQHLDIPAASALTF